MGPGAGPDGVHRWPSAGRPAKAAQAVITVLDTEDAPLRLTLGNDAVDAIPAAWNSA